MSHTVLWWEGGHWQRSPAPGYLAGFMLGVGLYELGFVAKVATSDAAADLVEHSGPPTEEELADAANAKAHVEEELRRRREARLLE